MIIYPTSIFFTKSVDLHRATPLVYVDPCIKKHKKHASTQNHMRVYYGHVLDQKTGCAHTDIHNKYVQQI